MVRNFLINIFFLIPVWLLKILFIFNKDIKRKYIFDVQSMALLSLMPKFEIHKISDDEIPEIRELIEERRVNLRIAAKTKKGQIFILSAKAPETIDTVVAQNTI